MQLIIMVLAAFGLGYWFANSEGPQRLAKVARQTSSRLGRKSETEKSEVAVEKTEA